ncbi:MAG: OmpA family protein [Calditrichaeota bacterium]|nr:MAG: OmpA family protein [Calditrichota bacterium]
MVSGSTDGRAIRFQWREGNDFTGTAIMVLSADGCFLNGLWYEKGQLMGTWFGSRVTDGSEPHRAKTAEYSLGKKLEKTGRAILYGIYFDSNSARLKPESTETLEEVYNLLRSRPELRLRIEGHTDATNTEAYNLALSRQRAQAVVQWLVERGIDAGRLEAQGFGESRPVADNSTPQGRKLNRRVEIVVVQ